MEGVVGVGDVGCAGDVGFAGACNAVGVLGIVSPPNHLCAAGAGAASHSKYCILLIIF